MLLDIFDGGPAAASEGPPEGVDPEYDDWDLAAVIAEFVLVRSDLIEPNSREQFKRAVLASADVADIVAAAYEAGAHEGRRPSPTRAATA